LELASEGTVKDALNEFGPLSESLLRRYTLDIVRGLNYLHSQNIIHRDIKPTNLLLLNNTVKIADFGCSTVSVAVDGGGDNMGMSSGMNELNHGTMAGTTIYMSPEVMSGAEGGYGRKADIWSLGITLCEMAHAKAPFQNATVAIYAVCVSKIFPTFPERYSAAAHSFLGACLREDVKERSTCKELLKHDFLARELTTGELRAQTAASDRRFESSVIQTPPVDERLFQSDSRGRDLDLSAVKQRLEEESVSRGSSLATGSKDGSGGALGASHSHSQSHSGHKGDGGGPGYEPSHMDNELNRDVDAYLDGRRQMHASLSQGAGVAEAKWEGGRGQFLSTLTMDTCGDGDSKMTAAATLSRFESGASEYEDDFETVDADAETTAVGKTNGTYYRDAINNSAAGRSAAAAVGLSADPHPAGAKDAKDTGDGSTYASLFAQFS